MKEISWPYFDPEFDSLPERIHGPTCRVCIDNEYMEDCTVVKVDSVNKQGLLLEVVQVLTDLNLIIAKSYISCDAGWFMDVFHVKDAYGNKLADQKLIDNIQQALGTTKEVSHSPNSTLTNKVFPSDQFSEHTAIELSGTDRPGLFSEISAALADLGCNVIEAHSWSHNDRLACVAYVSDHSSDTPIDDPGRLASIKDHLNTVLRATMAPATPSATSTSQQEVKTGGIAGGEGTVTDVERRLHQLMLSVEDFDGPTSASESGSLSTSPTGSEVYEEGGLGRRRMVSIDNCDEKGYSIVSVDCKDRPRLMFDTVCTLTDMQYVIFHAAVGCHDGHSFQEYFIRHTNGHALNTESEKERVGKCLEAAIERRVCEGIRVEVLAENRIGLLSDITRVLRENGLAVVRADIATQGQKSVNAFYVRGISGNEVDMEFVESAKKEMAPIHHLAVVKNDINHSNGHGHCSPSHEQRSRSSFGDILKSHIERFSQNFIAIK